jgi:hypothetical protein
MNTNVTKIRGQGLGVGGQELVVYSLDMILLVESLRPIVGRHPRSLQVFELNNKLIGHIEAS